MDLGNCFQPWYEMQFDYHQTIRPCCYYKKEVDHFDFNSGKDVNIKTIWNGKKFREYREIISKNKNDKSNGCYGCEFLKYYDNSYVNYFKNLNNNCNPKNSSLHKLRLANSKLAYEEYSQKKILVKCLPSIYYINFGNECNFKCTFCYQNIERENKYNSIVKFENLKNQAELFKYASQISIIGGEPLVIKDSKKFIDFLIDNKDFHDIKLKILSNGSLLHHYTDKLMVFDNIHLPISLEATGDDLEKIRVGAKWNKIERNILNFIKVGKKNKKNWTVSIACNIMKTSLVNNNLPNLIDWACKNELKINFGYINGTTDYDFNNEDIIKNPSLLDKIETKEWKSTFDKSLKILESYQSHKEYNNLRNVFNYIKSQYELPKFKKNINYFFKYSLKKIYRRKIKPFLSDKSINNLKKIRSLIDI